MKYISELAYANHMTQAKQLAKDKKQRNKYRQIVLMDDESSDDTPENPIENSNTIKAEDDRRNGSDRRKTQQERGRYVESRLKKNRRYQPELSLKI